MQITREVLRTLRPEIEAALAQLGQKHGIKLALGNGKFDSMSATFQLTIKQASADSVQEIEDNERAVFNAHAAMVGMRPDMFGKTLYIRGAQYTVAGISPGRSKNCVKIRRADGKGFVAPVATVLACLS